MKWARTLCGGSKVASLNSVPLVENRPNDNRHRYAEYSACYEAGVPLQTGVGCSRIVRTGDADGFLPSLSIGTGP